MPLLLELACFADIVLVHLVAHPQKNWWQYPTHSKAKPFTGIGTVP